MAQKRKENRTYMHARVDFETTKKIKDIAKTLGYVYKGEGSPGALMDAIANGEVIVIQRAKP